MHRVIPGCAAAVLIAGVGILPAAAQDTTHHHVDSTLAQQRRAALVLNHEFNAPLGEPVRVFLAKGAHYRATVTGRSIALTVRPLFSSVQQPLVEPLLAGQSAADETEYTITPRADAVYVFTTVGSPNGRIDEPVRLRISVAPGGGP
ncbi:MAG: hypothetical protein ACREL5_06145 [Gemmatimonadales bacterium]